jgi:hypothetical protein
LDVNADVIFGLTEKKSAEDTLLIQPVLPDEIRTAAPTRLQGMVMVVTLPKLVSSPVLSAALRTIEQGYVQKTHNVILFDLRYSGGIDLPLLHQIRASAARGWGKMPIVVFINRQTRGVAAVLTQQLSTHSGSVLLLGEDDETYGYGRKLVQQSAVLAPGLSPLTLTIGTEYLQPPGLDSNSDGYRMRLGKDFVIGHDKKRDKDKSPLDLAIEKAADWVNSAKEGDFGQVGTGQSDGNTASADSQQPVAGQIADIANSPTGQQAAGQAAVGDGQAQQVDPYQQQSAGAAPATPGQDAGAAPPANQQPDPTQPPVDLSGSVFRSEAAPRSF